MLLGEVASLVAKTAGEEEFVARLQQNMLALVIPDSSLEESEAVAALLQDNLEQAVFDIGGMSLRQTATICVVAWEPSARQFHEVLTAAERTLGHARLLGGGAIVHCGQFDHDFSTWQDTNWAGIDLSQLTARDVMVPFTLPWDMSDSREIAGRAIRHTGVAYVPCLGEGGLYQGILSRETLEAHTSDNSISGSSDERGESSLTELMETPRTVREDLPYADLMDHFTADDEQMVVVLRDERPLGYVTHATLSTLLESVDRETFHDGEPVASETDLLFVPEFATEGV